MLVPIKTGRGLLTPARLWRAAEEPQNRQVDAGASAKKLATPGGRVRCPAVCRARGLRGLLRTGGQGRPLHPQAAEPKIRRAAC